DLSSTPGPSDVGSPTATAPLRSTMRCGSSSERPSKYALSLTELPWQQRNRNGEKPVGPPPGPRCKTPRIEPPLAMGAKPARLAKSATAPFTAASELKA